MDTAIGLLLTFFLTVLVILIVSVIYFSVRQVADRAFRPKHITKAKVVKTIYYPQHTEMVWNGKFYSAMIKPQQWWSTVLMRDMNGKRVMEIVKTYSEFYKNELVEATYVMGRLTKKAQILYIK